MADAVQGPDILQENDARVVIKIVNESDGDGGTTVLAMFQQWQKMVKAHLVYT